MIQKLGIMFLLLMAVVITAGAVDLDREGRDPAYVESIVKRSQKIVDKLELTDTVAAREVTTIIANRYFKLNDIYETRDTKVKLAKETLTGDAKQEAVKAAEAEKDAALYRTHFAFPADLSLYLDAKQIDAVKDGMTYGVVMVTYKATVDMIPTLKEEEKAQIMAWLVEAREFAIAHRTPVIVHANCVRIGSHSNSDKQTLYRDENELAYVKEADPLMKFRRMLLRYKRLTEEELQQIEAAAKKELSVANRKALAAPDPDPKSIFDYVLPDPYIPEKYKEGLHQEENGEKAFMVTAINETLKEEFRHNPDTFIYGQDVANKEKGGVFNITKGMQQEFGDARVFNAPIAEDYIVGTANGMCRFDPKIHVVIEGAEFADYFWPAVEQYVECTHEYWRSNGKFVPNIVLRLASGGYIGGGLLSFSKYRGCISYFAGGPDCLPFFCR